MDGESTKFLPGEVLFHCRTCNATRPCPPGELHRALMEGDRWPTCCGMRMAVSFPHGHPELVTAPSE